MARTWTPLPAWGAYGADRAAVDYGMVIANDRDPKSLEMARRNTEPRAVVYMGTFKFLRPIVSTTICVRTATTSSCARARSTICRSSASRHPINS